MKTKIIMLLVVCSLFVGKVNAQWVVSDPGNLAQGIINASKEHHSDFFDRTEYDKEFSGNGKDLSTGKRLL